MRALGFKYTQLDLELLLGLNEAENALSFNGIYSIISTNRPSTANGGHNSLYYMSLERLIARRLVLETKRPNGWRQWVITAKGRKVVHELNMLAEKMLQDQRDQSIK